MYSYIKGKVTEINPNSITVENNNIGYLIISHSPYSFTLNQEVIIYTYLHVKEDVFSLYGFSSVSERALFLDLISVTGIGPKSALSILSSSKVEEIMDAISLQDAKFLSKFPGIGPKTAGQIILDLKGKLSKINNSLEGTNFLDSRDALLALGYSNNDINKYLKDCNKDLKTEDIIKGFFKRNLKG
jgi:Holliday junction DNA helicase RuvA